MVKGMSRAIDLTGQKFERLTAIRPTEKRDAGRCVIWLCLCDCGNEVFVSSNKLKSGGRYKSCGCLRGRSIVHGMSQAPIYGIWNSMIQRCENPNQKSFKNYGGRGIKVCDHWHSFENFYTDVGDPPKGKTLDRYPDNDGDYEPLNFRWASWQEQAKNRRPKSCGRQK